jgi:PAP2 superfamily
MIRFELTWQAAAVASACLVGPAVALRAAFRPPMARPMPALRVPALRLPAPRLTALAAFAQETGIVLALFALWQLAGSHQVFGPDGALGRARWLWHAERVLHMPSETVVQHAFLPHPLLIEAFNLYYAGLHFAVLIGCLVWLFFRYRASYLRVRTTVVLFTGLSLLVQLIPVAPPRMLAADHMVDTAVAYGQSVYGNVAGFQADQLSAMPSVHIGWSLLVAVVIVQVSRSRWRWLALGYPVLTTLATVVTANHFWLDGVAAATLLALALALQRAGQAARRRLRRAGPPPGHEEISPDATPAAR